MPKPLLCKGEAVRIRDLQPADIPAVAELAVRIWRAHYPGIVSKEQVEYMLPKACSVESIEEKYSGDKKQRFWLAHADNVLAGYAAVEPRESGVWFIDKLYVDTDRHGGGIGTALLSHLSNVLKPKALALRVNRKNIKAINFYFKHGFSIEGLDALDIGGGYVMDDFLMRKVF